MKVGKDSGARTRARTLTSAVIGLCALVAVLTVSFSAGAGAGLALRDVHGTKAFWHGTTLKASLAGRLAPAVKLRTAHVRPFTLKRSALHKVLAHAPWENTKAARLHPVVVSLPAPDGRFERFALYRTAIMAPGLQRKHPEIATYGGRGVDDPAATIVADLSPFGFHASVRSPHGGWYIDPYYRKNPNVYVPYNALQDNNAFPFSEHELSKADPAKPSAPTVPTGDTLRTYRLALITDPGYAAYVGPAAVTAAKVALIDRVDQPYHDDLSIRMQLIANNDLLNLNTWDAATAPNGPCGAAACFTQSQVTGCSSTTRARFVIGQIIGASNYDIGHLALGQPGGGVANLGVVGRSNKAGGCTGIPTPVGDFYAIDYVAHEMGHQFSGNHPFNGNQLNCSGGNRSAANSVEPGSGSSIMAYAGICLTDDLQRHSDPYFSERSQTEMSTYTSSSQAAINEVQTVSLRHFGGGNEVQTVTFGPGFQRAATIQPLSLAINGAPSATSVGGADETGNVVTIATGSANTLQVGDTVTIAGVAVAGYSGTFTVTSVPSTRSFTYTNPTSGLPRSGGGTITLAAPGLTESGNTVTVRTSTAHNRSVGDIVVIAGAGVGGYNGTWTIDSVPSARSFTFTNPTAGLANSGAGSATYSSPFQMKLGGNDSVFVGGSFQAYTAANVQTALSALTGAGTVTVSALSGTGFTVTYGGSSANTDVPSFQIDNLSCGGCFASVEETNHGGSFDSFTLNYNGNVSAPIVNGTNYSAAGISAALAPILPSGATATVAGFAGGTFNNTGFQVTYTGNLAATNVPVLLGVQDFTAGASGFTGETDKGGPVDNQGTTSSTGNAIPAVSAPASFTIPLRTPFALTGSATDADGDPLVYSWEQDDRGGTAGTSLLNNTKTNGPLFTMFPQSGQISDADSLLYNSPGENHLTTDPTRVFPDLQQILDNNTNADTGACPTGPIAQPVPQSLTECYSEFLPTSDYLGFSTANPPFNNASPLSLHMRFTARDGHGGSNFANTTLLLANTAGPFLVTSPNTAVTWEAGQTQDVTWDPANTAAPPVNGTEVKISLSVDGGHTYPIVLAASTPNDGSESVIVPNVATRQARIKIEAVGNVFFDVSNANFTILLPGIVGLDSVTLGGKSLVDSFDASAGPYGPANTGDAASIFSNGAIALGGGAIHGEVRSADSSVALDKGGLVTGDVTAGGAITNKGTINGAVTPNTPTPEIAAPAVPACSPYSSAAGISGKFAYNDTTGDLTVSGGKTATLADGKYCFHNLILSGGAVLTVSGPASIVLTGQLNASGGGVVNLTRVPSNLELASSFAGANGVILSGGSTGYLSVYAPRTSIALSGGSPVYGALLGKTLNVSGGSPIHYDVQLATVWAGYFGP